MSISTATLFQAIGTLRPGGLTLPSGYLSTFDQSIAGNAGSGAVSLDNNSQAGQKSFNNTFSTIPTSTTQNLGIAQFISSPLTAQTITSGSWTVNFGAQLSNATANFTWQGIAALYLVNGSTGAIRTTIFALAGLGSSGRSATGELTIRSTSVSGATFTATAQDYLALELGIAVNNTSGGSLAPNATLYTDGITAIGADNASTTNALASIIAPAAMTINPVILRAELPTPATTQARGPGASRAETNTPPLAQPRSTDITIYRMRGFDSNVGVNKIVYWNANTIDASAAQYNGSSGPVSDIVVSSIVKRF